MMHVSLSTCRINDLVRKFANYNPARKTFPTPMILLKSRSCLVTDNNILNSDDNETLDYLSIGRGNVVFEERDDDVDTLSD